jgi:hypothetical protein
LLVIILLSLFRFILKFFFLLFLLLCLFLFDLMVALLEVIALLIDSLLSLCFHLVLEFSLLLLLLVVPKLCLPLEFAQFVLVLSLQDLQFFNLLHALLEQVALLQYLGPLLLQALILPHHALPLLL